MRFRDLFFSLSVVVGVLCTPAAAEPIGDVLAGKEVYNQCKRCHEVGPGAKHRIGPHLNGIFGRSAASHDGFRYSNGLQRAGTGGLEWHADTLDAFIENPRALASGTRMSFRGISDPQDRANVVAYLRTYSDNPADIPEADPTATATDPDLDPAILALVGDAEYGAFLSGECTTCHQAAGGDDGIPSIVLWPEQDFVIAMHAYKRKQRPNPVMQMIAGRLGEEEIAALAAYFANLEQ
jgi:cytochrome c